MAGKNPTLQNLLSFSRLPRTLFHIAVGAKGVTRGKNTTVVHVTLIRSRTRIQTRLRNCIRQRAQRCNARFTIARFTSNVRLLSSCHPICSVLFLSIRVGRLSKVRATQQIQRLSGSIVVIFVAGVTRCTVNKCTINTLSCILGPIPCFTFSRRLHGTRRRLHHHTQRCLTLPIRNKVQQLSSSLVCCLRDRKRHIRFFARRNSFITTNALGTFRRGLTRQPFTHYGDNCLIGLTRIGDIRRKVIRIKTCRLRIDHPQQGTFLTTLTSRVKNRNT